MMRMFSSAAAGPAVQPPKGGDIAEISHVIAGVFELLEHLFSGDGQ